MAEKARAKYAKWGKFDSAKPKELTVTFSDKSVMTVEVPQVPFAAHYGLKQWAADKAAGCTGLAEYKAAVAEAFQRAADGQWETESDGLGFMINVIAWEKKRPVEEVRTALEAMDEDAVSEIRRGAAFKRAAAEYRAAQMKKAFPKPGELVVPGL